MNQPHTIVIPFVEVGFHEASIPDAMKCYAFAAQCPPPVDNLFSNDIVGDNDDYFSACVQKLANKCHSHLEKQDDMVLEEFC